MTAKTLAMRRLDAAGIRYTARVYDATGAFHAGADAAALLGVAAEHVYKTLVVLSADDRRRLLVVVPVESELDLRVLAKALGAKRLRMATLREAERMTGMQVGGISPLGVDRNRFDVVVDARAAKLAAVHVSAGRRGIDLEIAVDDLVQMTGARFAQLEAGAEST